MGVLVLTEKGVDYHARGVVHGQQQGELWTIASKPPMVAAVYLYQHPLSGHTLSAYPVLRWTTAAGTGKTSSYQYAPQCGSADLYVLSLSEQLAQVGVISLRVAGSSKMQHFAQQHLRRGVGCSATTMTVSQSGGPLLPICRQDSPGVATAHSHQRSCLVQCHLLR